MRFKKKKKESEGSPYDKLMDRALKLLSKRRLSAHELEIRLRKKKVEEEDVVKVLERLKEYGYLDDLGYAKDFISDRLKFRPRGIRALRNELYKKGIKKEDIETAVLNAGIDEEEIAKELIERKQQSLKRHPLAKRKQKAVLYLKSKGIQPGIIYKMVDEMQE
jgi:regulatory protein